MSIRSRLKKAAVLAFWRPAVACTVLRRLIPALARPWRPMGLDWEDGPHAESLAYKGFSGRFTGTVVTLLLKRSDVQASLPPELTVVDDDRLPGGLRGRDERPVILLIGRQTDLGKRVKTFTIFQTIPLFRPYLETFVAIPFLKPRAADEPCPCFHFARVPCSTFWPTELGILQMGWPKVHSRMEMHEQGPTVHYTAAERASGRPLLTAETDLASAEPIAADDERLRRVASMLDQPHVLLVGDAMDTYRFDLRLAAARVQAVSARGTVHPGLLPAITEPIEFAAEKISRSQFGAFFIEATFMNRMLRAARRPLLSTSRAYLRR
jgi:hypothetical protein